MQAAAISEEQPEDVDGWLAAWFAARASGSRNATAMQQSPSAHEPKATADLNSEDGDCWINGTGLSLETRAEWERRVQQGSATSGPVEEAPGGSHVRSDVPGAALIEDEPGANSVFIAFDALGGTPPAIKEYRDKMLRSRDARKSNQTSTAPVLKQTSFADSPVPAAFAGSCRPPLKPMRSGFLTSSAGLEDGLVSGTGLGDSPSQLDREINLSQAGDEGDGGEALVDLLADARVQLEQLTGEVIEQGRGDCVKSDDEKEKVALLRERLEDEINCVRRLHCKKEQIEGPGADQGCRAARAARGTNVAEGGGATSAEARELRELVQRDRQETQSMIHELESLLRARSPHLPQGADMDAALPPNLLERGEDSDEDSKDEEPAWAARRALAGRNAAGIRKQALRPEGPEVPDDLEIVSQPACPPVASGSGCSGRDDGTGGWTQEERTRFVQAACDKANAPVSQAELAAFEAEWGVEWGVEPKGALPLPRTNLIIFMIASRLCPIFEVPI